MSKLSLEELKNTATWYQELMVPALFEKWPDQILEEAKIKSAEKLLDVACGTGVLAIAGAERLGEKGFTAGLDMNPGMLAVAEKLAPDIEWHQGTAEDIPWGEESFDVVVSQFGLMFFEDKQKALREMFRVLKPGGRLVIAVFDSLDNIPGYKIMARIFGQVVGEEVEEALRFPFSLGEVDVLKFLCSKSGLTGAKINTCEGNARFPDVRTMVLADVKGWFPLARFVLDEYQIDEVVTKAESDLKEFVTTYGAVVFPMPAHFVTITKN
ncbi:class I SAM-dependent methyltransferase [Aliifodinibius salicampi]|uniref:Class I SAM-dependent methyltransferase n=1 Tax=Fodinibius salicampi TaxID=1920655 RepID=A0ABT3PTY1_9BACT|nr:class I SAM-dependent methyltransferase [Fodinibius salicampi]MCW9711302.1 class I SAM-dependent methyltransferase [Fodinibius salicampi]